MSTIPGFPHFPDTQQALLDAYTALLASASQMHDLATSSDWEALIDQRTHYVMLVDGLRQLDTQVQLDSVGEQHKAELLEAILEHDAEIRRLLVSRRDEISAMMEVSQQQKRLHRAYAPQQGKPEASSSDVCASLDDKGSLQRFT